LKYTEIEEAISIVKISRIFRAEIRGSDSVQENKQAEIFPNLTDDENNIFNSVQYKYMNIEIKSDDNNIATVEVIGKRFYVHGINIGKTFLRIKVTNPLNEQYETIPFEISVYKPLSLDPEILYLIPGSEYQINVIGGPKDIKKSYEIIESSINGTNPFNLSNDGVITGLSYGGGYINVIVQTDNETIVTLKLHVYIVELTDLYGSNNLKIYENNCVTLTIRGKSNDIILSQLYLQNPYLKQSISSSNESMVFIKQSQIFTSNEIPSKILIKTSKLILCLWKKYWRH
jgi:hypothetical protein